MTGARSAGGLAALGRPGVGLAALLAVVALAGCGSSHPRQVSAQTYIKSFCRVIGGFQRDVKSRSVALNELGTTNDPVRGKSLLENFLVPYLADTKKVVSQLKAAGWPKVASGKQIAAAIVGGFTQLQSTLQRAVNSAHTLPTASMPAFKNAAAPLATNVVDTTRSISSRFGGLQTAELQTAIRREPNCRSLNS